MNAREEGRKGSETARRDWAALRADLLGVDDFGALRRLRRRASRLEREVGAPSDERPLRIALLGGATSDFLQDALDLQLVGWGLRPEWHVAPFGVFLSELLEASSASREFSPDVALVLPTSEDLSRRPGPGDSLEDSEALARRAARDLLDAAASFRDATGAAVVIGVLPVDHPRALGHLGCGHAEDLPRFLARVQLELGALAPAGVHLVDVPRLAARQGLARWFDPRLWYEARQPVSLEALPSLTRHLAGVVAAIRGRSRKLVAVDLDNTLWGGVVGDDGVEGLDLGDGSPAGEAFKDFQRYLRDLRARGVLLAICSKNDPARVEEAFSGHPEMVLRLEDFVAVKASFEPKSVALRELARELDLGLDTFVFVDDNPAERAEVSRALPEVAVPDIGVDPAAFGMILEDLALFETVEITAEDRTRSDQYRSRAAARALEMEAGDDAGDYAAFLRSLEMQAEVRPFLPATMPRVTQLVNKTNQFNLTTVRLTREEVAALAADEAACTLSLRLRDRFGDHGLVSVAWGRVVEDVLDVEGWLMSCRVLRRGAEDVMLEALVREARRRGLRGLRGRYRATERNGMVAGLYPGYGFTEMEAREGEPYWELATDAAPRLAAPIAVDWGESENDGRRSDLGRAAPRIPGRAGGRSAGADAGHDGA